jgi:hypothetical protein
MDEARFGVPGRDVQADQAIARHPEGGDAPRHGHASSPRSPCSAMPEPPQLRELIAAAR